VGSPPTTAHASRGVREAGDPQRAHPSRAPAAGPAAVHRGGPAAARLHPRGAAEEGV